MNVRILRCIHLAIGLLPMVFFMVGLGACWSSTPAKTSMVSAPVRPSVEKEVWPIPVQLLRRLPSGEMERIGIRRGSDALQLPEDDRWFVQPLGASLTSIEVGKLLKVAAEYQLPGISLRGIRIRGTVDWSLLAKLPSLRMLDLTGIAIDDEALSVLTQASGMRALYLADTQISDEGMAGFAEGLPQLQVLDLRNTKVGNKAVIALQGLPLRDLSLEGTAVTDAIASELAEFGKTLIVLELGDTAIGDVGLAWLGASSPLEKLGLWKTKIGKNTFEKISQLPRLVSLNVSETPFDGAALARMAKTQSLARLISLDISYGILDDSDVEHLQHAVSLETLNLSGNRLHKECSAFLAPLSQLRSFSIRNTQCTNQALQFIADHPNLEYLDLGATGITSELAPSLAPLHSLQNLYLGKSSIDDEILVTVATLKALRVLHIPENPIEKRGAEKLAEMRDLEELNIEQCLLDDSLFATIVSGLVSLKTLDASGNEELSETLAQALQNMKKLQVVDLSGTQLNDAGLEKLLALPSVSVLGLTGTAIGARSPSLLRQMPSLRHVIVGDRSEWKGRISEALGDRVRVE